MLTTNLRPRPRRTTLVPSIAIVVGGLIIRFVPFSGYDDGWLDPRFLIDVGAVGLMAWAAIQLVRRRPTIEE